MIDIDFENIARAFRTNLLGSLMTSVMLFVLVAVGYVGYYSLSTGTPLSDILTSKQMRQIPKSNALIDDALGALLDKVPGAARTRISVVHNGNRIWTAMQVPLFKADTMWARAAPGYQPMEMAMNTPLSMWADFLPAVFDGKCAYLESPQLKNDWLRHRLESINVASFAVCPIAAAHGEVMGVLFLSFADLSRVPDDRAELFAKMRTTAAQVADYLELRAP